MLRPQPGDPSPIRRLLRGRRQLSSTMPCSPPPPSCCAVRSALYHPARPAALRALRGAGGDAARRRIAQAARRSRWRPRRQCCCAAVWAVRRLHGGRRASPYWRWATTTRAATSRCATPRPRPATSPVCWAARRWSAPRPSANLCWPLAANPAGCISPAMAFYHPRDPLESELRTGLGESLSARVIASDLDLDADLVR